MARYWPPHVLVSRSAGGRAGGSSGGQVPVTKIETDRRRRERMAKLRDTWSATRRRHAIVIQVRKGALTHHQARSCEACRRGTCPPSFCPR